jgi:pimeloyl-ACP methyl ester carboxylesterase
LEEIMRRNILMLLLSVALADCAPRTPETGTLDLGDAHIYYHVAGSGPAVVLIHGWAINSREWVDQISALSPQYRVVAYDRRGYGKSTGFADPSADPGDLRDLLDSLGIHSAVIVGHSAGADVAIRFAAALPDRVTALVLYGGGAPEGFPTPGPGFGLIAKPIARQYGLDSLFRMVLSLPQFLPGPHRTPAKTALIDSMIADYHGRDLLEDHPQSGAFPPAQLSAMTQWTMPTLFISGDHEGAQWMEVSDSLVRWMPHARKTLIPGGGHGVHLDEPQAFDSALLAFLGEVTEAR